MKKSIWFVIMIILLFSLSACNQDKTYTISFYDGDRLISTQEVQKVSEIVPPENTLKIGYQFDGWYLEDSVTKIDITKLKLNQNLKLYAHYTKLTYIITFENTLNKENNNRTTYQVTDESFELIPLESTDTDKFVYWVDDHNNPINQIDTTTPKNMTLFAKWEHYHEVKIHYPLGYQETTLFVKHGETISLSPFVIDNYDFIEVYRDPLFSEKMDLSESIIEQTEIYLYYQPKRYPITYLNVPSNVMNSNPSYYTHLTEAFELEPLTNNTGQSFLGFVDEEGLPVATIDTSQLKPITIYAVWDNTTFQIELMMGNVLLQTLNVLKQTIPVLPNDIMVNGYEFAGWYLDQTFTEPYVEQPISESIRLYAKTDLKVYTITYLTDVSVTIVTKTTYTVEDDIILLEPYKSDYHRFVGFEILSDDSSYITEINPLQYHRDLTIKLVWQEPLVAIVFDTDDGSDIDNYLVFEHEILDLSQFISNKDGYRFHAWQGLYDGTTQYLTIIDTSLLSGVFNLTAVFRANTYEVTFITDVDFYIPSTTYSINNMIDLQMIKVHRTGYYIEGFYRDADYEQQVNEITIADGDITLFVKIMGDISYVLESDGYVITNYDARNRQRIEIPSDYEGKPVIGIHSYAITHGEKVTEILIPNSIRYIDNQALMNFDDLTTITLPFIGANRDSDFGLNYIFNTLFLYQLREVILTDSIHIPNNAFFGAFWIETLDIVSTQSINDQGFIGLENLKNISLPDSLEYIGNGAMDGLYNIEELRIPNGVEYIGDFAFKGMKNLKELVIPNTVNYIGMGSLSNTDQLNKLTIPFVGKQIDSVNLEATFAYYFMDYLPENINFETFIYSTIVTDITITKADRLPNNAFRSYHNLSNITMSKVTNIGAYALYQTGLSSIDISLVDTIDDYALGSTELKRISIEQRLLNQSSHPFGDHPIDIIDVFGLNPNLMIGENQTLISEPVSEVTTDQYNYFILNNNYIHLAKVFSANETLDLAQGVNGYLIQSMSYGVFELLDTTTELITPFIGDQLGSIRELGLSYMYGEHHNLSSLKNLTITNQPIVHRKSINGTSLTSITIGEATNEIQTDAIVNNYMLEYIFIPQSVIKISKGAINSNFWATILMSASDFDLFDPQFQYNNFSVISNVDSVEYYEGTKYALLNDSTAAILQVVSEESRIDLSIINGHIVSYVNRFAIRDVPNIETIILPFYGYYQGSDEANLDQLFWYTNIPNTLQDIEIKQESIVRIQYFNSFTFVRSIRFHETIQNIEGYNSAFDYNDTFILISDEGVPNYVYDIVQNKIPIITGFKGKDIIISSTYIIAANQDRTLLVKYTGSDTVFSNDLIPYTLTEINPYAFTNLQDIKQVYLSNTINKVGYKAFYNISNLSVIEIPFIGETKDALDEKGRLNYTISNQYTLTLSQLSITGSTNLVEDAFIFFNIAKIMLTEVSIVSPQFQFPNSMDVLETVNLDINPSAWPRFIDLLILKATTVIKNGQFSNTNIQTLYLESNVAIEHYAFLTPLRILTSEYNRPSTWSYLSVNSRVQVIYDVTNFGSDGNFGYVVHSDQTISIIDQYEYIDVIDLSVLINGYRIKNVYNHSIIQPKKLFIPSSIEFFSRDFLKSGNIYDMSMYTDSPVVKATWGFNASDPILLGFGLDEIHTTDDFSYRITTDYQIEIINIRQGLVELPSEIDGFEIRYIGENAMKSSNTLILPNNHIIIHQANLSNVTLLVKGSITLPTDYTEGIIIDNVESYVETDNSTYVILMDQTVVVLSHFIDGNYFSSKVGLDGYVISGIFIHNLRSYVSDLRIEIEESVTIFNNYYYYNNVTFTIIFEDETEYVLINRNQKPMLPAFKVSKTDKFIYMSNDSEVILLSYLLDEQEITIPSLISNKKVVVLWPGLLENVTQLNHLITPIVGVNSETSYNQYTLADLFSINPKSNTYQALHHYIPLGFEKVSVIGNYSLYSGVFNAFSSLKSIYVESSVTSMHIGAFYGLSNIETLEIPFVQPNENQVNLSYYFSVDSGSASNIPSSLTKLIINNQKTIYPYNFTEITSIDEIYFTEQVDYISTQAFTNDTTYKVYFLYDEPVDMWDYYGKHQFIFDYTNYHDTEAYQYYMLPNQTIRLVGYSGNPSYVTLDQVDGYPIEWIDQYALQNIDLNAIIVLGSSITQLASNALPTQFNGHIYVKQSDLSLLNSLLSRFNNHQVTINVAELVNTDEYDYAVLMDNTISIIKYKGDQTELDLTIIDQRNVSHIQKGALSNFFGTKLSLPFVGTHQSSNLPFSIIFNRNVTEAFELIDISNELSIGKDAFKGIIGTVKISDTVINIDSSAFTDQLVLSTKEGPTPAYPSIANVVYNYNNTVKNEHMTYFVKNDQSIELYRVHEATNVINLKGLFGQSLNAIHKSAFNEVNPSFIYLPSSVIGFDAINLNPNTLILTEGINRVETYTTHTQYHQITDLIFTPSWIYAIANGEVIILDYIGEASVVNLNSFAIPIQAIYSDVWINNPYLKVIILNEDTDEITFKIKEDMVILTPKDELSFDSNGEMVIYGYDQSSILLINDYILLNRDQSVEILKYNGNESIIDLVNNPLMLPISRIHQGAFNKTTAQSIHLPDQIDIIDQEAFNSNLVVYIYGHLGEAWDIDHTKLLTDVSEIVKNEDYQYAIHGNQSITLLEIYNQDDVIDLSNGLDGFLDIHFLSGLFNTTKLQFIYLNESIAHINESTFSSQNNLVFLTTIDVLVPDLNQIILDRSRDLILGVADIFENEEGVFGLSSDMSITILKYKGTESSLDLTEPFLGYPVVGVASYALFEANQLISLYLNHNISHLGKEIVSNRSNLVVYVSENTPFTQWHPYFSYGTVLYDSYNIVDNELYRYILIGNQVKLLEYYQDSIEIDLEAEFEGYEIIYIHEGAFQNLRTTQYLAIPFIESKDDYSSPFGQLFSSTPFEGSYSVDNHHIPITLRHVRIFNQTTVSGNLIRGYDRISILELGHGVKTIQGSFLNGNRTLGALIISNSIETIGSFAFIDAQNTMIYLDPSVDTSHFSDYWNYNAIVIRDEVQVERNVTYTYLVNSKGEIILLKYHGNETHVDIESDFESHTVIDMAVRTFDDAPMMESLIIPDTFIKVRSGALEGLTNLQSLTLPMIGERNSRTALSFLFRTKDQTLIPNIEVLNITNSSLIHSSMLKDFTIKFLSLRVSTIEDFAFGGMTHLKRIHILGAPIDSPYGLSSIPESTLLVFELNDIENYNLTRDDIITGIKASYQTDMYSILVTDKQTAYIENIKITDSSLIIPEVIMGYQVERILNFVIDDQSVQTIHVNHSVYLDVYAFSNQTQASIFIYDIINQTDKHKLYENHKHILIGYESTVFQENYTYHIFIDGTIGLVSYDTNDLSLDLTDGIDGYSISYIGENAFNESQQLQILILPNSLQYVMGGALNQLRALVQLKLPFIGLHPYATGQFAHIGYLFGQTSYENAKEIDVDGASYFISRYLEHLDLTDSLMFSLHNFKGLSEQMIIEFGLYTQFDEDINLFEYDYLHMKFHRSNGFNINYLETVVVYETVQNDRYRYFLVNDNKVFVTTYFETTNNIWIENEIDGYEVSYLNFHLFKSQNYDQIILPFVGRNSEDSSKLENLFWPEYIPQINYLGIMNQSIIYSNQLANLNVKEIYISDETMLIEEGALNYLSGLETLHIPFIGRSRVFTDSNENQLGYIFGYNDNFSLYSYSGNYMHPNSLRTLYLFDLDTIYDDQLYSGNYFDHIYFSESIRFVGQHLFFTDSNHVTLHVKNYEQILTWHPVYYQSYRYQIVYDEI